MVVTSGAAVLVVLVVLGVVLVVVVDEVGATVLEAVEGSVVGSVTGRRVGLGLWDRFDDGRGRVTKKASVEDCHDGRLT